MKTSILLVGTSVMMMTSALANAQVPNYLMHNGMVIRCSSFVGQNERTTIHDPQMAKYDATPGFVIVSYKIGRAHV